MTLYLTLIRLTIEIINDNCHLTRSYNLSDLLAHCLSLILSVFGEKKNSTHTRLLVQMGETVLCPADADPNVSRASTREELIPLNVALIAHSSSRSTHYLYNRVKKTLKPSPLCLSSPMDQATVFKQVFL